MTYSFRTILLWSILLYLLPFKPAFAQSDYITLSGKIIDKETTKPVPFANVGIAGKSIGTVSNTAGDFVFKFPATLTKDSLKVSIVGYQTYTKAITDITTGPVTIALQPAIVELDEVQVKAKGKTGLDIFKEAVAAIPANYDTSAIQMTAFYKEATRLDTHEVTTIESIQEANLSALNGRERHDQLKTIKERRTKPDNFITRDVRFRMFIHLSGGAQNAFRQGDLIRNYYKPYKHSFINSRNFKHYQYTLQSVISDGKRSLYVIAFGPK